MKRWGMLAGLLMCAGCFTANSDKSMVPVIPEKEVAVAPPLTKVPPITPEQVTDKNGHQMAQSLEAEINREMQQSTLNSTPH